jgi:hypothetical protein
MQGSTPKEVVMNGPADVDAEGKQENQASVMKK